MLLVGFMIIGDPSKNNTSVGVRDSKRMYSRLVLAILRTT